MVRSGGALAVAWWASIILSLLSSSMSAAATQLPGRSVAGFVRSNTTYVDVLALARLLGDIAVQGNGSLTWRAAAGVLTMFDGSPDALLQRLHEPAAQDVSFSAPVVVDDHVWFAPADALTLLGLPVSDGAVMLSDGTRVQLDLPPATVRGGDGSSEVETLDHGLVALRFFAPSRTGSFSGGASLMLTDLSLLALVVPEQAAAIETASRSIGQDKGLLIVVTSLEDEPWESTLTFQQGDRRIEVRAPYRLKLITGGTDRVTPAAPVTAVALLPPSFSLYRPITVSWQGMSAGVTFRR